MLRSSWARLPAPVRGPRPRTLVSTVLLSKNWDTHSLSDLKSEAKQRGLPQCVVHLMRRHAPCALTRRSVPLFKEREQSDPHHTYQGA